jgi:hypothetical protein
LIEFESNALLKVQVAELKIVVSVDVHYSKDSEVGKVISGGN